MDFICDIPILQSSAIEDDFDLTVKLLSDLYSAPSHSRSRPIDQQFTAFPLDGIAVGDYAFFLEAEDIPVSEDVYRAINAAVGIVDYADTHKFDMIVISTCVQSKIERFFLGSTTEKVISYSHIPVFAIPPSTCAR